MSGRQLTESSPTRVMPIEAMGKEPPLITQTYRMSSMQCLLGKMIVMRLKALGIEACDEYGKAVEERFLESTSFSSIHRMTALEH